MDFTVPRVMGILNVTPDSFYDGWKQGRGEEGRQGRGEAGKLATGNPYERVGQMISEGAYIIDIGAVSTRPGASEVSSEEEKRRLLPVLREIRREFQEVIISVDTSRATVAEMAAGEGADMINDISGGTYDPLMFSAIVNLKIPYIIMHIQGNPADMQVNPVYNDVKKEVGGFLLHQAGKLQDDGHSKIILDPGFGFGKTVRHNFQLLEGLDEFVASGYPILAGLSRKSMINRVLNILPDDALNGTTVLNTIALLKGASILRVHDVKEAAEAIKLVNEMIVQRHAEP